MCVCVRACVRAYVRACVRVCVCACICVSLCAHHQGLPEAGTTEDKTGEAE